MQSFQLKDGDLVFEGAELAVIEGGEELAQCAEIVLGTNKNEWFLNPAMGIDFKKFVGKGLSEAARREEIRQGLRQEPRIQTVESIEFQDDTQLRTSSIKFVAKGTLGELAIGEVKGSGIG